ncbi:MAG: hypothetical protein U0Q18_15160 [Bryobacteraceae bacterium]
MRLAAACCLWACAAWAQPAPTLQQYNAGLASALQLIRSQTAGAAQPKILLSGQHLPGVASWIDTGSDSCTPDVNCVWNNHAVLNAYTDALVRFGLGAIDINLDVLPLSAASQYTGSLHSDCPNGWNCRTLAVYDAMIAHASGAGLQVRLAPTPTPLLVTACGLTAASTEADVERCFKPLYVAAAARWPQIESLTVLHEIGSGIWSTSLPNTMSVSDARTFIVNCSAAVKAKQASIRIGAAADTMFPAGENPYYNDWIANAASSLDFLGVDLYPNTWDVTQYVPTALALAATEAAAARRIGKEVRINETNRPPFVQQNAQPTGSNAILGNNNMEWFNNGLDMQWLNAMVPWAAANGFSSISVYATSIFIWYTTDPAADDTQSPAFMTQLLKHLSESTSTATAYHRSGQWWSASLQANARMTGRARLGN